MWALVFIPIAVLIFFIVIWSVNISAAAENHNFRKNAQKINIGMTLQEVETIMEGPADDIVELDKQYKWRRTRGAYGTGVTQQQRSISVTVRLEGGKVIGVDRHF